MSDDGAERTPLPSDEFHHFSEIETHLAYAISLAQALEIAESWWQSESDTAVEGEPLYSYQRATLGIACPLHDYLRRASNELEALHNLRRQGKTQAATRAKG